MNNHISSAVQKELNAKLREEMQKKREIYDRLKRLRKYKCRDKSMTMKLFHSILAYSKC